MLEPSRILKKPVVPPYFDFITSLLRRRKDFQGCKWSTLAASARWWQWRRKPESAFAVLRLCVRLPYIHNLNDKTLRPWLILTPRACVRACVCFFANRTEMLRNEENLNEQRAGDASVYSQYSVSLLCICAQRHREAEMEERSVRARTDILRARVIHSFSGQCECKDWAEVRRKALFTQGYNITRGTARDLQ